VANGSSVPRERAKKIKYENCQTKRPTRGHPLGRSGRSQFLFLITRQTVLYRDWIFEGRATPVVQVIEEMSGDILYTVRAQGTVSSRASMPRANTP